MNKPEPVVTIEDVRAELLAELAPARADAVVSRLLVRIGRRRESRAPTECEPSPDAYEKAHASLRRKGVIR
jgi:hypothetical protein